MPIPFFVHEKFLEVKLRKQLIHSHFIDPYRLTLTNSLPKEIQHQASDHKFIMGRSLVAIAVTPQVQY